VLEEFVRFLPVHGEHEQLHDGEDAGLQQRNQPEEERGTDETPARFQGAPHITMIVVKVVL
jgi:hypothetical protein